MIIVPGLGDHVRTARVTKQLLALELARQCGISASFLSAIENGHRTPAADVLLAIAKATGRSVDWLLDWIPPLGVELPPLIPIAKKTVTPQFRGWLTRRQRLNMIKRIVKKRTA